MRQLPICSSDFAKIRRNGLYYVDKSLLIRDVIDAAEVCLITRPRRFGKTLNLSTLRYFYTLEGDYRDCFEGLAIMQAGARYLRHLGQHPVIYLSLKGVGQPRWEDTVVKIREQITALCDQFAYLADWPEANRRTRQLFERAYAEDAPLSQLSSVLQILSEALHRYHQQPVVILIDEYDAPVVQAYLHGYYAEMIEFLRSFLGEGLKDNPHLEQGVLTGIMRVAKESIFSGLNNLDVFTVLTDDLNQHFGFTIPEVEQMIADAGMNGQELADIHSWYNGYQIGGETLFNPWSILQYLDKPQQGLRSYWGETSHNNLLKRLFFGKGANIEAQLETLIRGESLRKTISSALIYPELDHNPEAVWSLLLSAGYLKAYDHQKDATGVFDTYALAIPNREIYGVYLEKIREWVRERTDQEQLQDLFDSIRTCDAYRFEEALAHFALRIFSYHDTAQPEPEKFYHAFILGLLANLSGEYEISSNREQGFGRYDILLRPADRSRAAIVLELKSPRVRRGETVADALADAVAQLRQKRYDAGLHEAGYTQVAQWAVGVYGKELLIEEIETPGHGS